MTPETPQAAQAVAPGDSSLMDRNPKLGLAVKSAAVLGHAVAEKIRQPVPRTIDDVPVSGAALTTEWLTAVLCRDTPGAQVTGFSNPGGSSGSTARDFCGAAVAAFPSQCHIRPATSNAATTAATPPSHHLPRGS